MEYKGLENADSGMFAFIKNLQGDIVSIVPLDSESNVELNIEYDAWGKPIFEESSLGAAFVKAMIMAAVNVGYRGYFYDFETGLYYLRSRYYDPETGRFINADDTDYLGYDDTPLSTNLFAYCENNPVKYKDEKGYVKTPLWFLRKQAQKKVIDAMKDDYAKVIVEQWFYGGGKKYETARTRMDWSSYMTKNKKLKNKIIGYAYSALKRKKTSFSKKKDSLTLSDSGYGGYYTGYDLLNGSNYNYGGFEAEGSIRKIGNKKYRVLFTFVFNDFVDPNERYRNDTMWKRIMKSVVLYKGQGIDYVIKVSGGGKYDFPF